LAAGTVGLSVSRAEGADPTEVVILGTAHDEHHQNARYSLEILRDLIVNLKPAAILIEAPPTVGGKPTVRNDRGVGVWGNKNEGWASNAAAEALHVPVVPYDRDRRNDFYIETKYFDRQTQLSRHLNQWFGSAKVSTEGALIAAVFDNTSRSQTT
jgi:hypothetical protein